MISGIVMIFIALWFYQSAVKAKVSNVLMWVAIGAVGFFVLNMVLVNLNIYILESFRASEGGANYESLQGADRKNEGDFLGFIGVLKSLYLEMSPSIVGFLALAVVRLKLITKENFSVTNLFSGLKEMFQNIKKSFKTPQ
ncbi:hypothetical protein [Methylobacter sp. S3L5C]|uniref:hypothetical protein n=1 Tax=Methylobacter sp. S3L5C TaxID=2839024 RepID=UPI001FADCAD3|nr:hypothetical protein [Methylobacter sp. S3L5C]UOA08107.1 hypothetical protein KKZ03_18060 [Methylobacter sp. S3L5C]